VSENALAGRAEFDAAIASLREQITSLQLSEPSREVLHADVTKIAEMAGDKPQPKPAASDIFKGLVDKLKMAGIFLQTVAGLRDPLTKLAAWFHIPLPF
jgi:hypothetical protein